MLINPMRAIAIVAETTLQPPNRGAAVSRTLREISPFAEYGDFPICRMVDIGRAFQLLSVPGYDDDEPTAARRRTCAELAGVAKNLLETNNGGLVRGDLGTAFTVWMRTARALAHQAGDDPRLAAMARTWKREALELQALWEADMAPQAPEAPRAAPGA